ncbi:MAG: hypothetical protein ACM65L_12945 [Microcoleus sp.]
MANIFVGAKHDRCKSLVITNKLSAVMLRPYTIGMKRGFYISGRGFSNQEAIAALKKTGRKQYFDETLLSAFWQLTNN